MLYKTVLAMMLAVAPPGQSAHSVVVEPACGLTPGKPACDLAPAPTWSPFFKAFTRKETADEALRRFLLIARAIEKIALTMSAPTTRDDGTEAAPLWPFTAKDLAQALVTVAYHESTFRRDVHSGVGPAALGDCTYWDRTGRRVSAERARQVGTVRTSCQSVCLMQINTGGLERSRFGFVGRELVGLDEAATERCFAAGTRAFAEARARCAPARSEGWFARSVASYVTGEACETHEEWVKARVGTFERIAKVSADMLPAAARALLGADTNKP